MSWNNLSLLNILLEFFSNIGTSFYFTSGALINIKINETMIVGEIFDDVMLELVGVSTGSYVDNQWFDFPVNLVHGLVDGLVGAYHLEVGFRLQEWEELDAVIVVLLDFL